MSPAATSYASHKAIAVAPTAADGTAVTARLGTGWIEAPVTLGGVSLPSGRIFFPGLDALRFIAALSVLIQHVSQFQVQIGLAEPGWFHRLFLSGFDGVVLFFVLSGFLITYLLLAEGRTTGRIDISAFYVRRILRIWPLYFLLLAIALALYLAAGRNTPGWVQPHDVAVFGLYAALLANIALVYALPALAISQTWSIAVEEQFYLVWPLLMRLFSNRLLTFMLGVVAVKLLALGFLVHEWPANRATIVVSQLAFESLAIGGVGAVLVFRGSSVLRPLFHPLGQLATVGAFVAVVYTRDDVLFRSRTLGVTILSLAFAALILNVGCNERSLLRIGNPVLDYLGRISYGIYMFHPLLIYGIVYALWRLGWDPGDHLALQAAVYVTAVAGTITVAALSYRYFETPFLRLKKRFAHVESGGDAIPVAGLAGAPAMTPQRAL